MVLTSPLPSLYPSPSGMALGSTCVGVHMAMTQGVFFGMLASYIPAAPIPGVGRIAGTVWSLTDLVLGEPCATRGLLRPACHENTAG